VNFTVTATDNCPPNPTVSCTPASGSAFPLGPTLVTCRAWDVSLNTNTCSFTVTVVDDDAPTITFCETNSMVVADTNCQATLPDLTGPAYIVAVDNCSPSITITQSIPSGTILMAGTNVVVLGVFDAVGNVAYCTNRYVVKDMTPPIVTLNGMPSMTIPCGGVFSDPGATANDSCDGPLGVSVTGSVNTAVPGTYILTYSATDAAGNSASVMRTVEVVDAGAPVITSQPQSRTNNVGTTATFTVVAASCGGIRYQWCFGTNALPDETNAMLVIPTFNWSKPALTP
jgi:hypothetical protein